MSKQLTDVTVYHSDKLIDVLPHVKCELPYPYTEEMLMLCAEENPLKQEYYYIERGSDYAFFILYHNHMNIFTLGKKELFMNVKTVGFPCSLSDSGYITNNLSFMMEFIKTIKGGKLILNVTGPVDVKGAVLGETLPTCVLKLDCDSAEEYIQSLRSNYRRRIALAKKRCTDVEMRLITDASVDVHELYLNTYQKSEYKLECLDKGFFDRIDADKLVFFRADKPIGFVLLKKDGEKLIFMLCGMDYSAPTADLYYYMLFNIVNFAFENDCKVIDLGQTSEHTKLRFGAKLDKRYFYAVHSNFFLSMFAKMTKPLLEYRYSFPEYKAVKTDSKQQLS